MRTDTTPVLDRLPKEIDRVLYALAQTEAFQDTRPALSRIFGAPKFAWQVGWMTAAGASHVFVHLSGWPPELFTKAKSYLGSRFVVVRAESGLLAKRRPNPFMIVLISGRRDDSGA